MQSGKKPKKGRVFPVIKKDKAILCRIRVLTLQRSISFQRKTVRERLDGGGDRMNSQWNTPFWIGERMFEQGDLDMICWTVKQYPGLSITELAHTICENINWHAANGKGRVNSCVRLLGQLEGAGILKLPEKRKMKSYETRLQGVRTLPAVNLATTLAAIRPVTVELVPKEEQQVWDATVNLHHGLGFKRAFGAHQRYWIYGHVNEKKTILGGFLFAAPARHIAARDAWIGWNEQELQRFRERVVSNSRMCILKGVEVKHLASHALGIVLRRLPKDWKKRYGYTPVVVETFVTPPWKGTCYLAANFVYLGQTTGTGRQDREYKKGGTVRSILAYPLFPDWRTRILAEESSTLEDAT